MQPLSALHAMALAYADMDIPVFICEENGKKPKTARGYKDATTDKNQINAWYKENPNYNLAFCPADAGLFVVDVDPGAAKEIVERLTPTYTTETPRGGSHHYYEGVGPSTVGKIAPHIDSRSIGGYVLVPPSVIDGKYYRLKNETEYSSIPAWVSEAIATSQSHRETQIEGLDEESNLKRAREFLKKEPGAVEFQGSDLHAYRVICAVKDLGVSQQQNYNLVTDIWLPKCEGQWDEAFIGQKIYNAYRYGQNTPGVDAIEAPDKIFGDIAKKLAPPEKQSRFHFKDESEQDAAPDAKWLIPDLIVERSTVLLYAPRSSYKSLLAVDIMMGVAAMRDTFSVMPTLTGPVFYGAREGHGALRKHRRAWRMAKQIEGKVNFFLGLAPLIAQPEEVSEFHDAIKYRCDKIGQGPAMICLDTVARCMTGMDENAAKDVGVFIEFCDSLVSLYGCSVIGLHHSGHEKGRARGSTAFEAGVDTILEVRRHADTHSGEVHVHKQKEMPERDKPWTFETKVFGPSIIVQATTPEQNAILNSGKAAFTPKTVGAALKKLGINTVGDAIPTIILAKELVTLRENESIEEQDKKINATARALTVLARRGENLESYTTRQGKALYWHLTSS